MTANKSAQAAAKISYLDFRAAYLDAQSAYLDAQAAEIGAMDAARVAARVVSQKMQILFVAGQHLADAKAARDAAYAAHLDAQGIGVDGRDRAFYLAALDAGITLTLGVAQ